jgi:hypothetical protein
VLNGLRHGYAVAKERLFPSNEKAADNARAPHERFSELASKVVIVPKSEIDRREKLWAKSRKRPKR